MQLLACQYDIQWENRSGNFQKIRELLARQDIEPGALIALPEMFSSGFSMNVARIAEAAPSESEQFLSSLAQEYQSWAIGGLVYQNEDGQGRNELAVFDPEGQLVGRYQKNHCFSYTGESSHYQPGEDVLIFDWNGFKVCPVICYDLRFPELFRRGVKAGANLFIVIANWPDARADHWTTLLKARAIENQAIVVGVNRSGKDPGWNYPGLSMIIDSRGAPLATAGPEECCLAANVSLEPVLEWRQTFQALADMKPQARP